MTDKAFKGVRDAEPHSFIPEFTLRTADCARKKNQRRPPPTSSMQVPSQPVDSRHNIVRRPQELARERSLPLYSTCGSSILERCTVRHSRPPLPWIRLARYSIPTKMIPVIRQSHDGTRERVRLDTVEKSECSTLTRAPANPVCIPPLRSLYSRGGTGGGMIDRFSIQESVAHNFMRIATRGEKIWDELNKMLWPCCTPTRLASPRDLS